LNLKIPDFSLYSTQENQYHIKEDVLEALHWREMLVESNSENLYNLEKNSSM